MTATRRRPDLLPIFVLAGLVLLMLIGWWAFPHIEAYVAEQDCIASGHNNCS